MDSLTSRIGKPLAHQGGVDGGFYDGEHTLAVYIASRSDIDDLVPMLSAYQIEQRKLHHRFNKPEVIEILNKVKEGDGDPSFSELLQIAKITDIPVDDLGRLSQIWSCETADKLLAIAHHRQSIAIRSLAGSLADYKRATRRWWLNVERHVPNLSFAERPVYFFSSNTHSMANLLCGYALYRGPRAARVHRRGQFACAASRVPRYSTEKRAQQS